MYVAGRFRGQALESHRQGSNPGFVIPNLCDFGQGTYQSLSLFVYFLNGVISFTSHNCCKDYTHDLAYLNIHYRNIIN